MAIWCERFSPYSGGINLLLIDLYVDPLHRKNGIGKEFFSKLRDVAASNNYTKIEWFVDANNKAGKDFYTRLGGTRLERSEHWKLDILEKNP